MIRISYRWLQDFLELPESPEVVKDLLTYLGFEVENMHLLPAIPDGVFAAYVLDIKNHPKADKLHLVTVDLAGESKTVVCGAPNVAIGQWVPLALVGTKIGDITLTSKPIRGIVSDGMICSERELGRSDDHSGIWVLGTGESDEWEAGEALSNRIINDAIFEIEVTLNRPDCLSHLGIARELAAKLNRPWNLMPTPIDELDEPASDQIKVVLDDSTGCPRYRTRLMRKVDAKRTSPFWIRERLKMMGTRSINAVVDATNYVLYEVGHPLHAFDRHFLHGNEIGTRSARKDEKFVTLDDIERVLQPGDVLIRDSEHAVALGGIMGGKNSEIRETTHDILLEAAYFNPVTIRHTAKRLGLATESSKRFERGADPEGVVYAMERVTSLIQMLAGGEVYYGVVDSYPKPVKRAPVSLREKRLHAVLGYNGIKLGEAEQILNRLGFSTIESDKQVITVSVPSHRHDVFREIDLIEEAGRIHGYNFIPTNASASVPMKIDELPGWGARRRWGEWARSLGLSEAVSNSMVDPDDLTALGLVEGAIHLTNPIAPELSVMRPGLLISLLTAAAHNMHHGRERIALYEIGRVFGSGWIQADTLERWHLGIILSGAANPEWWRDSKPRQFDASDVIGILEQMKSQLGLESLLWKPVDSLHLLDEAFVLSDGKKEIGYAGRISGAVRKESLRTEVQAAAKRFDLDRALWCIELNCEALPLELPAGRFKPFSRFPMVVRDLSYQVPAEIAAEELLHASEKGIRGLPFVASVSLFDRHEDKTTRMVSLGIRLRMQADDRTLTEQEIASAMEKVILEIGNLQGVTLRGNK